jgi:hypothetical protein
VAKTLDVPISALIGPSVEVPREADLRTQVVEHHFGSHPWVIAAFDREEDADLFVQAVAGLRSDCTYSTRLDPEHARRMDAVRPLRRDPAVTEALMGMDA